MSDDENQIPSTDKPATEVILFTREVELKTLEDISVDLGNIKEWNRLDQLAKINIGRQCNAAKAKLKADGRSWTAWRDHHLSSISKHTGSWMRAPEATDRNDIKK